LTEGDRARGYGRFGLDPSKRTLLVFGGSQGAQAINALVREALADLPETLQVLHVCGAGNLDPSLDGRTAYRQFEYLDAEFADAFACADVVVSRAGANSLAELIALRKPAVVIPLPTAASRGDQIDNARLYVEKGFGLMEEQGSLSAAALLAAVERAFAEGDAFRGAMERDEPGDPIDTIADLVAEVAR